MVRLVLPLITSGGGEYRVLWEAELVCTYVKLIVGAEKIHKHFY